MNSFDIVVCVATIAAMTMGFNVADRGMLDRLKPGDKVRFNAEIRMGEATVTYIESAP